MRAIILLCTGMLWTITPEIVFAQPAAGGVLRVTVVDATGAVIVGATVTVTGIETTTKDAAPAAVETSPQGIATVSRLVPGRYAVEAMFPGFETRRLPDV